MSDLLRLIRSAPGLTRQQRKTLYGLAVNGDEEGARKGLWKILKRGGKDGAAVRP